MQTQAPEQLYGFEALDSMGNKIGKIDGVWVDDATGELEFIGVKTGWLMGKTHIIPAAQAQIDNGSQTVSVPYAQDQIKDAPSYGTNDELSPDDESQIYSYYGIDRSTGTSPTGLPSGDQVGTYQSSDTDTGERSVQLSEEELQVGKRSVEAGRVRLRKVVHTEQQEVPVDLRHEEVNIERVPAGGQDVPDSAFQEQEIEVPVMREEPVVGKEARVTGQVQVDKTAETETRTVGGEVRREDVEVDRDPSTDVVDRT
jgi:uncharacterized protein (TIGR02271 family)